MIVGRFAPSPSGRMHLGNVFAALMAWCAVRSQGGEMVLRIEDLDPQRCRREYALQLMEDLRWLGLDWDREAPWQSQRTQAYARAFDRLAAMGLVYPCFCSRGELHAASAPHAADGRLLYAGTCRNLTPADRIRLSGSRTPAWRLQVPEETVCFTDLLAGRVEENLARECGDFLIRRSDGVYAYQLAVVVDDAAAGVTQVVRGEDLLSSTARQLYLYRLLEAPAPAYCHIPLLVAPDGRRLSKRDRDLDLGNLRLRYTPQALIGLLAHAAGLQPSPAPLSARELAADFSLERLSPRPICLQI